MARNDAFAFSVDLKKFAATIGVDLGKVRRRVALSLLGRVTRRTPVDTGRLRSSWNLSDGSPDVSVAPEGTRDQRGNVTATFRDPFEASWLTNNLPYALAIEFGHSRVKAPNGMVRVSLAEEETELLTALGEP